MHNETLFGTHQTGESYMFFLHNRTNDMAYSCYLVNPEQIKSITQPVHNIHYMHHITVDFGIPNDSPLPPKPKDVRVI